MKRMMIAVACVLMAAALGGAASAFADPAPPVWFECVKVAKGAGEFAAKNCHKPPKPGKGDYLLREGLAGGKEYKGRTVEKSGRKPAPELYVNGAFDRNLIHCEAGKGTVKPELPDLGAATMTWSKCTSVGTTTPTACTSPGAKSGEIRWSPLEVDFGGYARMSYYDVENGEGIPEPTVGAKFENATTPGGVLAEFKCGSELEGTMSGELITRIGGAGGGEGLLQIDPETEHWKWIGGRFEAFLLDNFAWHSELKAMAEGEQQPQVISVELCGKFVEVVEGSKCAPPTYAALEEFLEYKGPKLFLLDCWRSSPDACPREPVYEPSNPTERGE